MKAGLKVVSPTLSDNDLSYITFESATLSTSAAVKVTAVIIIKSGGSWHTTYADFMVTIRTAQEEANTIKAKIKTAVIGVAKTVDADTTNTDTVIAIKTALKTANPTLTDADLTKITFAASTLTVGTPVPVTATIAVGTTAPNTATINLVITRSTT